MLNKDSDFKHSIESSVKTFSSRFRKRDRELGFGADAIVPEILMQSCRDYLLEECAIIMKLWPINSDSHCQFLLYPGKMTKALAYTYEKFVVEKDLFKWNKFILKKTILLSENNSDLLNLQEKVAFIHPSNEREKYFFMSVLAGCESIMSQPKLLKDEKLDMLFKYTHQVAFFSKPIQMTTAFESTSKVINFCQK